MDPNEEMRQKARGDQPRGGAEDPKAKKGDGKDAMYVWPYFAELDLRTLTPSQEVELYRLLPPAQALAMKQSGRYTYYRAGLGGDGVWHYFMQ